MCSKNESGKWTDCQTEKPATLIKAQLSLNNHLDDLIGQAKRDQGLKIWVDYCRIMKK